MSSQEITNADNSVTEQTRDFSNSPALPQATSFVSPISSQGSTRFQFNFMNTYQSPDSLSQEHQETSPVEAAQPALNMSVSAAISGASAILAETEEPELKKVKLTNYNFFKSKLYADSLKQGMTSSANMCTKSFIDKTSPNSFYKNHKRLEERIGSILCCTVCLDLPSTAIYQVN